MYCGSIGRSQNRPGLCRNLSCRRQTAARARIDGPGADRRVAPDLDAAAELVRSGALLDAVEAEIGALG